MAPTTRTGIFLLLLTAGCGRSGFGIGEPRDTTSGVGRVCTPATLQARRIVAGGNSSCVVLEDDSLWCWGANDSGQLADGTRASRTEAARIEGIGSIDVVALGGRHGCALTRDGQWCWGRNHRGQLGVGNLAPRLLPEALAGSPPTFSTVVAGSKQSMALTAAGDLYTWGRFNGVNGDWESSPVPLLLPQPVRAIATASAPLAHTDGHACAVLEDGEVQCWGSNPDGQLGDGTTTTRPTPAPVLDMVDAVEVTTGNAHSCARTGAGAVYCWGQARNVGTASDVDLLSATLLPLSSVTRIVAGGEGTCALRDDRTVWCWGIALSVIGTVDSVPQRVPQLDDVVDIALGNDHACALRSSGSVFCWGSDRFGQLGRFEDSWSTTAAPVTGLPGPATAVVSTQGDFACAVVADDLWCWGSNDNGQLGAPAPVTAPRRVISGVTLAEGGRHHLCAALSTGTVRCLGRNNLGQLGTLQTDDSGPVDVTGPAEVTSLGLGLSHSCARESSGTVWCWGSTSEGRTLQTGAAVTGPGRVVGLTAEGVAAGGGHTCVWHDTGGASCFGRANEDQIGNAALVGDAYDLTPVDSLTEVTRVNVGRSHSCALLSDETVWCWGYNDHGQLGRDSDAEKSDTPQPVVGLSGIAELSCSQDHCCARRNDASVWCWGSGAQGQLGDGGTSARRTAVEATELRGAVQIATGRAHSCALMSNGDVSCVGSRQFAQLGRGETPIDPSPSIARISCQ